MRAAVRLLAVCFGLVLSATPSMASTRVAVYAVIDEVAFEPSDREPDRVLISGTFVVPVAISSGDHARPSRGLLYFSLNPDAPGPTRTDWRALRKAAGTGEVVGFGQYWMPCSHATDPRIRSLPAETNCSLDVRVQTDRTQAIAEPYPAPSSEGVVTAFDDHDDICPRFGRPSVRIVAELREAHSPGGVRNEPRACKEWIGLVASSSLERTFPTQTRDADWARSAETLILRRLTEAQGLALAELGVECRDTICHVRLTFPTKEYQQAMGNRLWADALDALPGFEPGGQFVPSETDATMDTYIQRRKPSASQTDE